MFHCPLKVLFFLLLSATACAQPNAAFTFTNVCEGNPMHFTNQSTAAVSDSIIAWKWNFGDGDSVTVKNPNHTYSSYGVYSVRLIVTTVQGLRDTVYHTIESYAMPNVSISANPFTGCEPLVVQFGNATTIDTGSIATWLWDFDDGTTSPQEAPSHVFTGLFHHGVQLFATSNKGCLDSAIRDVFVLQNPICDFTAALVSLNDSSPIVNFTNLSSGGNIDLLWDFGDGDSSTAYSLTHTYDTCGTYNVILTATGTNTCVTVANYLLEVCDTLVQIYNAVNEKVIPVPAISVFPNPSNGQEISISYELEEAAEVSCFIFDFTGKLIASPVNRNRKLAGKFIIGVDEDIMPGIYFVVFDISGKTYSRRLIITN